MEPPGAAQVFRTYNASVTLDRLLSEQEAGLADEAEDDSQASPTIDSRKADYDRANKEVRRLANHVSDRVAIDIN